MKAKVVVKAKSFPNVRWNMKSIDQPAQIKSHFLSNNSQLSAPLIVTLPNP